MMENQSNTFDFDEMARLATEDPDGFERRREQLLAAVIEQASPDLQRRLKGLQWQVDQVRMTTSNPMASCIRISQMMWDSVLEKDGLLENLQRLHYAEQSQQQQTKQTATVVQLFDEKPAQE